MDADGIPSGLGLANVCRDGFSHFLFTAEDFAAAEGSAFQFAYGFFAEVLVSNGV